MGIESGGRSPQKLWLVQSGDGEKEALVSIATAIAGSRPRGCMQEDGMIYRFEVPQAGRLMTVPHLRPEGFVCSRT
jgi:hypothetical protein